MKRVAGSFLRTLIASLALAAPGSAARAQGPAAKATALFVCHGYGCEYRTKVLLDAAEAARIAALFARDDMNAAEERAAIAEAVRVFEEKSAAAIGIRDRAKSIFGKGREKGQMDCIDESTNTHSLLLYLDKSGYLRRHDVRANRSRGIFVDGRYPHATAVIADKETREVFAVDSWFEPAGGPPDIMLLSKWMTRGVMGER